MYCPPDEFMVLCECAPFASTASGMPYLLSVKVFLVKGAWLDKETGSIATLSAAIRKALGKQYKRIEFETIAIFYGKATDNNYQLHLIRAREEHGIDAKDSFKKLAEYVEGPSFLRLVSGRYSYDAELTNTVTFWKDPETGYRANDTKNSLELQKIYENKRLWSALRWSQELSKLLFCQQVELNNTEFTESNGVVTLNASSVDYKTTHYYHPAEDKIRICTEDFRKAFPVKASSCTRLSYSPALLLVFLAMTC